MLRIDALRKISKLTRDGIGRKRWWKGWTYYDRLREIREIAEAPHEDPVTTITREVPVPAVCPSPPPNDEEYLRDLISDTTDRLLGVIQQKSGETSEPVAAALIMIRRDLLKGLGSE